MNWEELKAAVIQWTNKPTLVAETEMAIRQAIRIAHRQGKFWRDLTVLTLSGLDTDTAIQVIDIPTLLPRFKQIKYIRSGADETVFYKEVDAADLLSHDGYVKAGVFWGVGSSINFRGVSPEDSLEVAYYTQPITSPPESIGDWLLDSYSDLVVLLAAGNVLGMVGESEIKKRVDSLMLLEVSGLQQDQIEVTGR